MAPQFPVHSHLPTISMVSRGLITDLRNLEMNTTARELVSFTSRSVFIKNVMFFYPPQQTSSEFGLLYSLVPQRDDRSTVES